VQYILTGSTNSNRYLIPVSYVWPCRIAYIYFVRKQKALFHDETDDGTQKVTKTYCT
jgi:hypothetical protein